MRSRPVVVCTLFFAGLALSASAQVPGQNVNMVAGTQWPGGDPFLQRQNEPSMAVSSRNPLHLLAGANDYRTVDLPGLPDGNVTGDAWLGLFKSTNGGGRWTSTLVPGYPQDQSADGLASPLKQYAAGADAVVKAGTHGLFYYGGLVFDREIGGRSAIFMARYVDRNNKENGDPFGYLGTSIVASSNGDVFLDKPAFAVGLPTPGATATCSVDGVQVASGPVYAAWTEFLQGKHPHAGKHDEDGDGLDDKHPKWRNPVVQSRIMLSRSLDCGRTWSRPAALSGKRTNQSAAIAIDPRNGDVYVAWRQFTSAGHPDAIMITKSTNGGKQFTAVRELDTILPFDQGTTGTSFRTNSYPAIAIDNDGRLYAAWSARGFSPSAPDSVEGDARIVIATSLDGKTWSMPRAVDNFPGRGHQIMPAMAYAGGRLQLVYYDLREDVSGFFERFVDEFSILRLPPGTPGKRRHTLDVRTAQADAGPSPQFTSYAVTPVDASPQASQYLVGSRPGSMLIEQLQFNPPNLPLFALGSVPFIGDYIDVAARTMAPVRNADGSEGWRYTSEGDEAVFHLVWADNRNVRPPLDGDWANYTPPFFSGSGGPSTFDPTQTAPACVPGQAGMRNQNIYTSRVTPGLVAGSPGNAKPLSTNLQRAFVVFAQNTTHELALYRFSVRNQPPGGQASLLQFDFLPSVDVLVPAGSSAARTVYVTSTDPKATVFVDIVQIAGAGVPPPPPEGRSATVVLNPDITNPDITNPDITNPDITNPDITNAEIHNPDITNPDITNPDITNPDITNPDITNPDITNIEVANPDITNPDITNPDITNPDITNPDITNPDITNPDITNGSITDYSYTVTNEGNTASSYDLNLEETDPLPDAVKLQLVVHRTYQTPVVDGCDLKVQTQNQVLMNLPRPTEFDGVITFWLEPGESITITFRVIDTDRNDGITWDPTESLDVEVEAQAVNWDDETGPDPDGPASDSATPPIAADDVFEVAAGDTLDVEAPGVIGNDTIFDDNDDVGPTVEATLVEEPGNGELDLRPDGSFTYSPFDGFSGEDTFTYRLVGGLRSNVATVTIAVTGDPLVVTNTNDSGFGSLRGAIDFANEHPNGEGPDVISFDIPSEGGRVRMLPADLMPVITDPVVIDGTSQPGEAFGPMVVLDFTNVDPEGEEGGYGLAITAGDSTVQGLAIINTPGKGVVLSGGGNNSVQGNWIGVDPGTLGAAPTSEAGLAIMDGSSGNMIGVVCGDGCFQGDRNLISGNDGAGIAIYDGNTNFIGNNWIGLAPDGRNALPNGEGIAVSAGSDNTIGLGELRNVIAGNTGPGVVIRSFGANPDFTSIRGNWIGLNDNGDALGNGGAGILLMDVSNASIENNVIAANLDGVLLQGTSSGNFVDGNTIGLAADGDTIAGNQNDGVDIHGPLNVVSFNTIGGNGGLGIDLGPNAHGTSIIGNRIGTDPGGSVPRPNDGGGISGEANDTIVGGLQPNERNVISGNGSEGIHFVAPGTGNRVLGNYVGVDASGSNALPNEGSGIVVTGAIDTAIGSVEAGGGNVISGNAQHGIAIAGGTGTEIMNNLIGLGADGESNVGNGFLGVLVASGSDVTIGTNEDNAPGNIIHGNGAGGIVFGVLSSNSFVEGNEIRNNNGPGILVQSGLIGGEVFAASQNNAFIENLIYGNDGLSIDLAGGGADIDPEDADSGANRLQNRPEITAAIVNNGVVNFAVQLEMEPVNKSILVEFFQSGICPDGSNTEARRFLGSHLFSGNAGSLQIQEAFFYNPAFGNAFTATVTVGIPDVGRNTSELSECVSGQPPNPIGAND